MTGTDVSDCRTTETEWGWSAAPYRAETRFSIALVTGQHGNEYAGLRAGAAMADRLYTMRLSGRVLGQRLPAQVFCALGVNAWGIARDDRLQRGVDLNRTWPDGPVVSPIWDQIVALPKPVYVIDVHSTRYDIAGSGRPVSHVITSAGPRCSVAEFAPEWMTIATEDHPVPGSLEDVATGTGIWAVTVELAETGVKPTGAAVAFIDRAVRWMVAQNEVSDDAIAR